MFGGRYQFFMKSLKPVGPSNGSFWEGVPGEAFLQKRLPRLLFKNPNGVIHDEQP